MTAENYPYYQHYAQWEEAKCVPRELWQKAGQQDFLCISTLETYGGGGADDYRFNVIVVEALVRASVPGVGFPVAHDMVASALPLNASLVVLCCRNCSRESFNL